ncbi:hypothetical protein F4779DRAFT_214526 [Xylariaceae sp. FL0662B]|nr:hypothetical protein F4779DRAFT_214526 [Xylariaceae sp. FL0662B]
MPQDPNLYGQRPAKKQKKEIPLSSSLAFTSQLTSLLSTPSTSSPASASSGRSRPSKIKDDIFSVKAKRKPGSSTSKEARRDDDGASSKLSLKDVRGTEEEKQDLARTRRKMEEKARLYAAMKRGDYIAKENDAAPLVDFDRKWAEKHPEGEHPSSSGSDNDDDDDDDYDASMAETVEYKDEFGRTRRGTRAEVLRQQRRTQRSALGAAELERMAARPTAAPESLIYGDTIQSGAFDPASATWERMAALAAKRDRSATPPPDVHFDGAAEIRTKGVGFYQFSRDDAAARRAEMDSLARERDNTERVRAQRRADLDRRRRDIEDRRARIGQMRAERLAENFLDGLAGEMATATAIDATGSSKEKEKEKAEAAELLKREASPL